MSAAATAAGYLYASGRLRGRGTRDGAEADRQGDARPARRHDVKVAVYAPEHEMPQPAAERPVRTPKIQYRTRRWKPE